MKAAVATRVAEEPLELAHPVPIFILFQFCTPKSPQFFLPPRETAWQENAANSQLFGGQHAFCEMPFLLDF